MSGPGAACRRVGSSGKEAMSSAGTPSGSSVGVGACTTRRARRPTGRPPPPARPRSPTMRAQPLLDGPVGEQLLRRRCRCPAPLANDGSRGLRRHPRARSRRTVRPRAASASWSPLGGLDDDLGEAGQREQQRVVDGGEQPLREVVARRRRAAAGRRRCRSPRARCPRRATAAAAAGRGRRGGAARRRARALRGRPPRPARGPRRGTSARRRAGRRPRARRSRRARRRSRRRSGRRPPVLVVPLGRGAQRATGTRRPSASSGAPVLAAASTAAVAVPGAG